MFADRLKRIKKKFILFLVSYNYSSCNVIVDIISNSLYFVMRRLFEIVLYCLLPLLTADRDKRLDELNVYYLQ